VWKQVNVMPRTTRRFVCLLLNGTSALFRSLVPRIVEVEHMRHVELIHVGGVTENIIVAATV